MMDPIGVPFDKPIIQRMKPFNGILQTIVLYADTRTIFRGRLYWSPLIHRKFYCSRLGSALITLRKAKQRTKAGEWPVTTTIDF
jgi:hypothetical protein